MSQMGAKRPFHERDNFVSYLASLSLYKSMCRQSLSSSQEQLPLSCLSFLVHAPWISECSNQPACRDKFCKLFYDCVVPTPVRGEGTMKVETALVRAQLGTGSTVDFAGIWRNELGSTAT